MNTKIIERTKEPTKNQALVVSYFRKTGVFWIDRSVYFEYERQKQFKKK